jgi:ribosomal protein S27AE
MEITLPILKDCPRCGGTHYTLHFRRLRRPIECDWEVFRHWVSCPKTGEPILLAISSEGEEFVY